jgi:hypothetical protein
MLFDLRGRGRRRVIKVVYLSLALLLGGGLVLFGIGGDVQGGLFDAFREDQGQDAGTARLEQQIETLERRVAAQPENATAWAQIARLRYQTAGVGEGFDQNTGQFTDDGRARLRGAEQAWERYLALEPAEPDDTVAIQMVQAFGPAGLNQPEDAVTAMEIVIEEREENPNLFGQLAQLAYLAGQDRKGDLAADRAVSLAPEGERSDLRAALEAAKSQAAQAAAQSAAEQAPPTEGGEGAPDAEPAPAPEEP